MENKYEYEEVDDFDEDVSFDLFFFNTCMSGNFMCLMIVHALSSPSLGVRKRVTLTQEWEDKYIERHQVKDVDQKWKRVDIYKHPKQKNVKKGFTRYVFCFFLS